MTTTTKIGMPLDEFLELGSHEDFEIINGKRKPRLPQLAGHAETKQNMFGKIDAFGRANGKIEAFMSMTVMLTAPDDRNWVVGSREPDILVVTTERLEAYKAATPDYLDRPLELVPDMVVEVVAITDTYSDLDEKIDAYLLDGVRLIWVANPELRKVTIYAPDLENPVVLKGDAVLDGGDVLPNFQIPLATLFA